MSKCKTKIQSIIGLQDDDIRMSFWKTSDKQEMILKVKDKFVSRKILVLSKDYFENIPLYKIFKFKVLEVPPYIKESYITKKIKSPLIKIGNSSLRVN